MRPESPAIGVIAERGSELRDGLCCGTDAGFVVLPFLTATGTAVTFRAHELLVRHAVDAPHGDVVEYDDLLAHGRLVDLSPKKARLLEAGRVRELVVIDRLLQPKFCGRLEDDAHQLVLETLHDGTYEKVSARVSELDGASGVQGAGCAVGGLLVTSVVSGAERLAARTVGGEDHGMWIMFSKQSAGLL